MPDDDTQLVCRSGTLFTTFLGQKMTQLVCRSGTSKIGSKRFLASRDQFVLIADLALSMTREITPLNMQDCLSPISKTDRSMQSHAWDAGQNCSSRLTCSCIQLRGMSGPGTLSSCGVGNMQSSLSFSGCCLCLSQALRQSLIWA